MALDYVEMGAILKTAMLGATSLPPLGVAIANYIHANWEIEYAWVAFNPVGIPDSMTEDVGNFINVAIIFPNGTGTVDPVASGKVLSTAIEVGMAAAMYRTITATTTPAPLAIPPGLDLSPTVGSDLGVLEAHPAGTTDMDYYYNSIELEAYLFYNGTWATMRESAGDAIYEIMAKKIITWLLAWLPPTPLPGSHGAYTGAATPTKVK